MKQLIILLSSILLFSHCAKKSSDMMGSASPTVDKTWRKMAPGPAAARDIALGNYTTFDLANGLKVIVVENHKLPRVSYQLSLNNEALIEGDKAGYTSFAGDLLSKGTSTRNKSQIDETIDYIGASLNTSSTGIFATSLKKHSDKLLDVMADVLYNPVFPKEEFEKLRKRTASNLSTAKTNPEAIAGNIKSIVNYGKNHPYGEVQTEETIKNITIESCKEYYKTYFKPNNAYLVIVGDITPELAKMQAEKYFNKWEKGDVPSHTYVMPLGPKGKNVAFGDKAGAVQSVINISYPVDMKPGSVDAIKANVMNSILGGGIFSGRLMQNLREKKAYTYGARSNISNDRLVGNFNAFASVRNEVTDSSVTEFIYELERIIKEPVSVEDLQLSKNSLAGNFARSLESPQTIANFALNTFRYNLPKDYYNNYLKNLEAVNVADISQMSMKYIRPENCNIIVVGNKDNVADKLKKFDSDGVIDFYDPFGKKLEEKKIELSPDVTAAGIIADYINAIGGAEKLKAVKTKYVSMKTSMMGQDATFETYHAANPNKFALKIVMMGMTVNEQKFDGVKGIQSQMGQKKTVTDGPELETLKEQAIMFDQLYYNLPGYKLEVKSIENIDGVNCYKVVVTNPKQEITTEFYDIKSNLLVRSMQSKEMKGQSSNITTDYKDYKDVSGIMIPFTSTITGAMPAPMVLETVTIDINKVVADEVFKVE
ncbi:MAG: insulinase family protein [Saprospiraceae bacterium]|nr:insulinase family protein [Saprospiraceae bacterium]